MICFSGGRCTNIYKNIIVVVGRSEERKKKKKKEEELTGKASSNCPTAEEATTPRCFAARQKSIKYALP